MWKDGRSEIGPCWEPGGNFTVVTVIREDVRVWKRPSPGPGTYSGSRCSNIKWQQIVLVPGSHKAGPQQQPPVLHALRAASQEHLSSTYRSLNAELLHPTHGTASSGSLFSDQRSVFPLLLFLLVQCCALHPEGAPASAFIRIPATLQTQRSLTV